jgi:hypothetical protein
MGINHLIVAWKEKVETWRDARELRSLRQAAPGCRVGRGARGRLHALGVADPRRAGRHAARLKERMLAAYGIEPETMGSAAYGALRQSGITCSHCRAKRRCALELERGTARANATFFCPNASTFDALTAEIGR